ncbi:HNH endonuclease [Pseudoroseomonas ludipueritiae]|uniref:HNH endonuclease n=1 Tax=Pseudoroseomonas ludipueritiae TaxID=198093 RepID=A0ABR7RCF1_9PROT|nr:HNH endonuclease signature motif containing protein [Pseudoroseomonas ludipueritiae]MBC9179514.1 HNH endonuclease [Pseudoroseomonas ludipueritiae]
MNRLTRADVQYHVERLLKLEPFRTEKKLRAYRAKTGVVFYVKQSIEAFPLIVEPRWFEELTAGTIEGVTSRGEANFSSGYREFPRAMSPKGFLQFHGCDVAIQDDVALRNLLRFIGALRPGEPSPADPMADIKAAETDLASLPATEREALVQARLGQGRFRSDLIGRWGGQCAVTGIAIAPLLRASHIKPWRYSTNRERLDPENGLLLLANLDAAFDAGLISFSNEGKMLLSRALGAPPAALLGMAVGAGLRHQPSVQQQAYLELHREAAGFQ